MCSILISSERVDPPRISAYEKSHPKVALFVEAVFGDAEPIKAP